MARMKIVTGSNHGLPKSIIEKYDIRIIPFPLSLGEENYRDGIDITLEDFLKKLKNTKLSPKTAALPMGELNKAYQELSEEADAIFSVQMSSGLSIATYQAAQKARETVKADVEVVDTKQTLGGVGLIILEIAEAIKRRKSKAEVLQIINEVRTRTNSIFALPDIMYLYRGGRIGRAKSLLGSIMKIIPLIAFRNEEGMVSPLGKARNVFQANEKIIGTIKSDMEKVGSTKIRCVISDVDNKIAARQLKETLQKNFECEIIEGEMPCCGVVYLGPKAWGLAYYLIK